MIILGDGTYVWYENGQMHNLNGPALIYKNGQQEWYVKGKHITDQTRNACVENDIPFDHNKWTINEVIWFRLWASRFC